MRRKGEEYIQRSWPADLPGENGAYETLQLMNEWLEEDLLELLQAFGK